MVVFPGLIYYTCTSTDVRCLLPASRNALTHSCDIVAVQLGREAQGRVVGCIVDYSKSILDVRSIGYTSQLVCYGIQTDPLRHSKIVCKVQLQPCILHRRRYLITRELAPFVNGVTQQYPSVQVRRRGIL